MEIVYKVTKNNKIFGAVVLHNNDYKFIIKEKLHSIGKYVTNATITEDCKIVPKSGTVIDSKDIKRLSIYHGSKFGIKRLTADGCNRANDFGSGFYTNTSRQNAEEFIHDRDSGVMYEYLLVFEGLSVYRFNSAELWGYFVSYNRGNLSLQGIPVEYRNKIIEILTSDYDIISGPIADDSMTEAYLYYKNGVLTSTQLFNCLKCAELGTQVVVRTQKGISHLYKLNEYRLDKVTRDKLGRSARERYFRLNSKLKQYLKRRR